MKNKSLLTTFLVLATVLSVTGCTTGTVHDTEINDANYSYIGELPDSQLRNVTVNTSYGFYSDDKLFEYLYDFAPSYCISQNENIITLKLTDTEASQWVNTIDQTSFEGITVDGTNIRVSVGFDLKYPEKITDVIALQKIRVKLLGQNSTIRVYLDGKEQPMMTF